MGASAVARLLAVLSTLVCLVAAGFLLLSGFDDPEHQQIAGWLAVFMLGVALFAGPALWLLADLHTRGEAGDERPSAPAAGS